MLYHYELDLPPPSTKQIETHHIKYENNYAKYRDDMAQIAKKGEVILSVPCEDGMVVVVKLVEF